MNDLNYALRALRKSPGFTAVVVTTLALGIGANTAMFTVLYGALLRALPYAEPDRLVALAQSYPRGRDGKSVTYVEFQFLERHNQIFESLAGLASVGFNLSDGARGDRVRGLCVSRGYFRLLGVAPALGRGFTPEEDQPGGPSAIVLDHRLWQQRFGGDSGVIGRSILLDGTPTTVVGVMPPTFRSPDGAEAWSTLAQVGQSVGGGANVSVIGRLRPGLSLAQARAGMALLTNAFRNEFKGGIPKDGTLDLDPYRAQVGSDLRTPVRVLLGAIGFVLLIACANAASLMLGRASSRQHELAVRTALGATRGQLVRQLLTESVLLGLAGGATGLLLASWGVSLVLALAPGALPATADLRPDGWVLGFTAALSLLTGLAFGVLPAWQVTRTGGPYERMQETSARTAGTTSQSRLRHALVVGEIALSLVLLLGAGLLIQTFARLLRTDPGFDARHLVSAELWLTGTRHDATPQSSAFYDELTSRVERLPGVEAAAVIEAGLPLEGGGNTPALLDGSVLSVDFRSVTPGFFRTLGTPVLEGREFNGSDRVGSAPVIIVSKTFVRRYLAESPALGRTLVLRGYDVQTRQIVGVVGDARSFVGDPAPPTVFIPSAQTPELLSQLFGSWFPIHVVVRTKGDPSAAAAQLAAVLRSVDPLVPLGRVRAMEEVLWSSLNLERFLMVLLSVFAGLAIVLAAVGIYGVISQLVGQRTRELGVRRALGAQSRDLLRMVLGRGAVLAGLGLLLGLVGSLAVTRVIAGFLYGVRPTDLPTILGVTAVLASVALIATWLPARRAARVDPMVALRHE